MRASRDDGSPGLGAHPRTGPEAGPRGSYCFTLSPSASLKFFLAASSSLTKVAIAARVSARPETARPTDTGNRKINSAEGLRAGRRLGSTPLDSTRRPRPRPLGSRDVACLWFSAPPVSRSGKHPATGSVHGLPPLGSRDPLHLVGVSPIYARLPARGGARSADLTAPPGPAPPARLRHATPRPSRLRPNCQAPPCPARPRPD